MPTFRLVSFLSRLCETCRNVLRCVVPRFHEGHAPGIGLLRRSRAPVQGGCSNHLLRRVAPDPDGVQSRGLHLRGQKGFMDTFPQRLVACFCPWPCDPQPATCHRKG